MNKLLKTLLLGGSATALAAGAAYAQNASALDVEEIQSSVSRIDLKGFEAPTPVTVVGIEQINRDAKTQIGDQIRELPQVRGGNSINNGSMTGCLVQVNAGTDSVAIRGLGSQRNLVLFDRQRMVSTTLQDGIVDLALIPAGLTQRVDVVTGGASAAWGSDAVTGVINVVINKTFEGFKGSASYADSTEISNPVYRLSLAWGTSFLGGKGHTVFGADFTRNDRGVFPGDRDQANGNDGRAFVINPNYCATANIVPVGAVGGTSTCASPNAGQRALIYAYGVGGNTVVQGGLTSNNSVGVAGSGLTAGALKNVMFVGGDADPQQFYTGTTSNTTQCYNGCTNDQFGTGGWGPTNPYHSSTFFSYTSYQILPDVKASIQLNYARLSLRSAGATVNGTNRTIYADNPFIPDAIAQRFVCNPTGVPLAGAGTAACVNTLSNGYNPYTERYETSAFLAGGATATALTVDQRQARPGQFLVGGFEFSANRASPSPTASDTALSIDYNWDDRCNALYQNCGKYHKQLMRGVFSLDGTIGDSWTWSAYISHAQTRVRLSIANNINVRVNNALDAVRISANNQGTSGLPIGSIQCRGLLNPAVLSATLAFSNADYQAIATAAGISRTSELAGCQPFNPFGDNPGSNAARNYMNPGINPYGTDSTGVRRETEQVNAYLNLSAGAFSMSGVLPWQLPAGEIGVAFGGEWRLHRDGQRDINPHAGAGLYTSGNFGAQWEGKLHAEEGFLEVAIPILKDTIVQTLNIDVAGRLTHYSFSGLTETWKVGLQSQINDDLRFRMTWSYDLRAPNTFDLFNPLVQSGINCVSFVSGPTGTNGGAPNQCFGLTQGNPNLNPEKANTIAAGFVFTPTFWGLDGLTASLDWYQIHLHGAIVTPGQNEPLDRCRAAEIVYCSLLVFANGLPYPAGTTSQVSFVYRAPVNAGVLTTAGFDFNIAYGFDLFTGSATVAFNGNYVYEFGRDLNNIFYNGIGSSGGYYPGGARFQGNLNFDYREGAWSFGIQERITGNSQIDRGNKGNALIQEAQINYASTGIATLGAGNFAPGFRQRNYNAFVVSTDLRVQYRWSNNITLFTAVDNVQNLPTTGGINRRSYRAGIRWNY